MPHPDAAELARLLDSHDITVDVAGDDLTAHGTTTAIVSQIAFDHRIQIVEITETSRSLEEILLDMTGATPSSPPPDHQLPPNPPSRPPNHHLRPGPTAIDHHHRPPDLRRPSPWP